MLKLHVIKHDSSCIIKHVIQILLHRKRTMVFISPIKQYQKVTNKVDHHQQQEEEKETNFVRN